jgi:isopentenyl-diphosphate delta-isomerase
MQKVILVDEKDQQIGIMEKLEAHQKGLLHRAFSIFIFDQDKKLLLQQRSNSKYHSAGLWSNTCCSHPEPDLDLMESAKARLEFEMGLQCDLVYHNQFIYQCPLENGLQEHELDYILIGFLNTDQINFNTDEVQAVKRMSIEEIKADLILNVDKYTYWLKEIILKELINLS